MLAIPALAALAADPVASLCGTAFVGRLGATPLAAVGTALSVQASELQLTRWLTASHQCCNSFCLLRPQALNKLTSL